MHWFCECKNNKSLVLDNVSELISSWPRINILLFVNNMIYAIWFLQKRFFCLVNELLGLKHVLDFSFKNINNQN